MLLVAYEWDRIRILPMWYYKLSRTDAVVIKSVHIVQVVEYNNCVHALTSFTSCRLEYPSVKEISLSYNGQELKHDFKLSRYGITSAVVLQAKIVHQKIASTETGHHTLITKAWEISFS